MASLKWLACITVASVVCASPCAVRAASVHGGIFVTSLPAGAAVWMDGTYVGETPLLVDGTDSGRHAITLIHSGWLPQSTYADVAAGHIVAVSLVLAANGSHPLPSHAKGSLLLRAAAGSKAMLDGALLPETNEALSVDAGDHILSLSKPGGPRQTQIVHIYPQITTVVVQTSPATTTLAPSNGDDVLAMLDEYVPASNYTMSPDGITIHFHGIEVECAIGSKTYTLNGKTGTLDLAPAMVGKKAYLPLSLLKRITGAPKTAQR